MIEFLQLVVLFFVLFDPFASLALFYNVTAHLKKTEKTKMTLYAVSVALWLALLTLIFGDKLLTLFHTTLDNFRVAGGIVIILLGVKMTLGYSLTNVNAQKKEKTRYAVAALIGTPLLTGPAVMTSIIVLKNDYGSAVVALAVLFVLLITGVIFLFSDKVYKVLGERITQVITTFFGLITVAWGVGFLRAGLGI